jgi:putative nucleotidyltransferase with HDIG domain
MSAGAAGSLTAILDRVDSLPTIPVVADQIAELVNDPNSNAETIARALASDQSLTAKVLKLANSAYYAIPGGVSHVRQAISFLGFNTLYQLVLSVSVLSAFSGRREDGLDPRGLWQHSLGCAALAELCARKLGLSETRACFTGGLLHDIGKVALLEIAPDQFHSAVELARRRGLRVGEAEKEIGLPSHDRVGSRLAERWRFPMPLRIAIAHERYLPLQSRASVPRNLSSLVDVVSLANTIVRRIRFGDPGDDFVPELDREILERLNLTATAAEGLRDQLMREVEKSKVLLDLVNG